MNQDLLKGSRSRTLATLLIVIVVIFAGRLFYLQIIQHDYYRDIAAATQQTIFEIPAERGQIYAKSGDEVVQLVMNQTVYTVVADPKIVTDDAVVVDALREIAGSNMRQDVPGMLANKDSRYAILATKLTRVQAEKLKEKELGGVILQKTTQRVYPEGGLAAHVLGFVNAEGQGNYGIEGALNDELTGKDGMLKAVTDVSRVPLTIGDNNVRVPAQNGKDVILSIDRNIQAKVQQSLAAAIKRTGADEASVIVMDPQSGRVMAMANLPTYDPATFFNAKDVAVFNNGVISAPYEPGSTIKALTLATAVDKNVVKPTDTFVNTDSIRVADRTISNATKGYTGTVTFQTAIQWSMNTGMVTIAQRLGNGSDITAGAQQTIFNYFHDRFRLGEATGIELAGEATGTVIAPSQQNGGAVRYSNMSFGQGMETTMVQVAGAFGALINGGTYYKPTVIEGYRNDDGTAEQKEPEVVASEVIKSATSSTIRDVLTTARAQGFPGADRKGYAIGGKTGTSQVIRNGVYSSTETIGSYVGFGGGDTPEYVIMVKVSGKDKELQGARDAMPVFTDISNWLIDYLKIAPRG